MKKNHQGIQNEIRRISLITIMALIIGLLLGYVFVTLLVAGFLYSCWLLYQTRNFYLWLEPAAAARFVVTAICAPTIH